MRAGGVEWERASGSPLVRHLAAAALGCLWPLQQLLLLELLAL